MKNIISILLILQLTVLLSCSKSEDTPDPAYVGTWERTWFSNDENAYFYQTIDLDKTTFRSIVNTKDGDIFLPFLEYNGTHNVIDNTLEAWITKIGIADNNANFTYTDKKNNNFDNFVFDNLNIHSNFIGTYFIDNTNLTFRLDMDGDRSVTGDEGLFAYKQVNN